MADTARGPIPCDEAEHSGAACWGSAPRQWLVLLALAAVVMVSDQATKWLAWRHLGVTVVNRGGFIALSPAARAWFARPTAGAVADGIGVALVLAGAAWLLHRRRSVPVLLGGALVIAGWLSNLLDRLGLHDWTAPGSRRGVVDFIPTGGGSRCNVADAWIALGAVLLVYTLVRRWWRATS